MQVSKAKIAVDQKPWTRVNTGGLPHDHGTTLLLAEKPKLVAHIQIKYKHSSPGKNQQCCLGSSKSLVSLDGYY